ncbi:DUF4276 family protein [Desulfobacter curvatus]|uniref:DUF4276 family protein n=1 Tax=Desulfobacter curvatus TaxID=2290 RepID=UPI00037ADBF3|nr:DUF4276 family protein [Desulfobacter curvatus]
MALEKVRLSWNQKGSNFPMQPYHLSDGSIRFICLATALLQPNPPSTIIIDEPELGIDESTVATVISECGSPEAINNNPQTAPSKRLDAWSVNGKFLKTTMGVTIAKEIGIEKIRNECPLFNEWLKTIEEIQRGGQ